MNARAAIATGPATFVINRSGLVEAMLGVHVVISDRHTEKPSVLQKCTIP
jgi:hypothetical protein